MSSEGYFDDDIDDSLLNQVDAIEAAHFSPANSPAKKPATRTGEVLGREDSDFFDLTFDNYDEVEAELQRIERTASNENILPGTGGQIAGLSNRPLARTMSKNTVQTTLFGDVLQSKAASSKVKPSVRPQQQRTKSTSRNLFGHPARKTKQWDHTAFAKTGWKKSTKGKGKGKMKGSFANEDEEEEEVEFEQFPAPFVSVGPPPPMKLRPDLLATKTWIYPLNQSKRDYQFNIVKHSLFENTLVALPTGLGKTFIAGVVMLNFYNWFPDGKVVFVAPTKPLVAQQIDACHKTCGIPGSDAAELTGNNPRHVRARLWEQKRVFYLTPQTLMNDLATENCDPRDIVLLVIDEAHKGTGDYAYAQVVRFLMAKNPHFRILALTATPGGKPEAVQEIIDALHISRIEIRNEDSLDLRGYMHKKITEQHVITPTEDIVKIRDLLVKLMEEKIKPLRAQGILYGNLNPINLQPFRCNMAMQDISKRPDGRSLTWAYSALKVVGQLARAMGYLLESSIKMCYSCLQEIASGTEQIASKKAPSKQSGLRTHRIFQEIMKELEEQHNKDTRFSAHPKMERLKMIVLDHFVRTAEEPAKSGEGSTVQTKVMVFVTFRECVDEIVEWLNQERPTIKATKFVGQGADKQGNKGFGQKEQLEIIRKFKDGEFNVLVATSVGEEGLDIGEVDMVVCYDAQQTPIRMLQRIGRTGRKRDGYIHVLVAESREEANWAKAKEKYQDVQQSIVHGEQLELYGDVERLLPDDVNPQCVEMTMDIVEYVRDAAKEKKKSSGSGGESPTKGKKRKRNDDLFRNIPPGAQTGFVNVKDLLIKGGAKKRKKAAEDFDPEAGADDDTDMEIEAGVRGPRRAASTSAAISSSKAKKLRKTRTTDVTKKKPVASSHSKRGKKVAGLDSQMLLQLSQKGVDDSDDMEIEKGISLSGAQRRNPARISTPEPVGSPYNPVSSSPDIPLAKNIIELDSSENDSPLPSPRMTVKHSTSHSPWSQGAVASGSRDNQGCQHECTPDIDLSMSPLSEGSHAREQDMSWLLDGSSPLRNDACSVEEGLPPSSPIKLGSPSSSPISFQIRSPPIDSSTKEGSPLCQNGMPPPPLPSRFRAALTSSALEQETPELTFAIRAPVAHKRHAAILEALDSSPLSIPPSQRRLKRIQGSPTSNKGNMSMKRRRNESGLALAQVDNPWIDIEAAHSGDECSEGLSEVEEMESGSDRQFLEEPPETQMSASYDQSAAYRQSLLTQAPVRGKGPVFANRPLRRGPFGPDNPNRRRPAVSSSPPKGDDLPDEYAIGSFIVDDEVDISYLEEASSEL